MFKIGEFSKLTRVTVKMLRHYDELGLLQPSFVEPGSGYRRYRADQLPRLNQIIALKDLGFGLEEIAVLIDEHTTPAQRAALLRQRRSEIEQTLVEEAARLRQLEALESGGGVTQPYDVVLREVPTCRMATIRRQVPQLGEPVTAMFEQLEAHVARHRARAAASPLLIFHDEDHRDRDLDLEAGVPIGREIDDTDAIRVRDVEGCSTMACVIYRGGYEQTGAVLQTLLAWTELHALQLAGAVREVYLRFGADQDGYRLPPPFLTTQPSEYVTELQLPVARGGCS